MTETAEIVLLLEWLHRRGFLAGSLTPELILPCLLAELAEQAEKEAR